MKRLFWIPLLMLCTGISAFAQQPEEKNVIAVIKQMFDGMKSGDTTSIRAVLDASCRLQTAFIKDGKPMLENGSITDWMKSVAGAKQRGVVLDERILSYEVRVDDNLATAWTPYELYVSEKFNHCGVDAFQLVRMETGWKIIQICDTRRKEGCKK